LQAFSQQLTLAAAESLQSKTQTSIQKGCFRAYFKDQLLFWDNTENSFCKKTCFSCMLACLQLF